MITNEREYRITKAQLRRLEESLAEMRENPPTEEIHPVLKDAVQQGLLSQIEELREQLADFESLRSGKKRSWTVDSLGRMTDVVIQARIANGMTQRMLADQLHLKEQQVQRYEATRYRGVSLERIEQVMAATGLQLRMHFWRPGDSEVGIAKSTPVFTDPLGTVASTLTQGFLLFGNLDIATQGIRYQQNLGTAPEIQTFFTVHTPTVQNVIGLPELQRNTAPSWRGAQEHGVGPAGIETNRREVALT